MGQDFFDIHYWYDMLCLDIIAVKHKRFAYTIYPKIFDPFYIVTLNT